MGAKELIVDKSGYTHSGICYMFFEGNQSGLVMGLGLPLVSDLTSPNKASKAMSLFHFILASYTHMQIYESK